MTNRWIMQITAPDGATSAWGSWREYDTAAHLADKLREHSSHYTGDPLMPDFVVTLDYVERWPGLKAAIAELDAKA
jgi:hypothetical protein